MCLKVDLPETHGSLTWSSPEGSTERPVYNIIQRLGGMLFIQWLYVHYSRVNNGYLNANSRIESMKNDSFIASCSPQKKHNTQKINSRQSRTLSTSWNGNDSGGIKKVRTCLTGNHNGDVATAQSEPPMAVSALSKDLILMPFFLSSNFLTFSIKFPKFPARIWNICTSHIGSFPQKSGWFFLKNESTTYKKLLAKKSTRKKWLHLIFSMPFILKKKETSENPNFFSAPAKKKLRNCLSILHKKKQVTSNVLGTRTSPRIPRNPTKANLDRKFVKNNEEK